MTEQRNDAPGSPGQLARIREHGNGLRDERSLYLRQHVFNPLDWQPWGEAALARARELDRPIFLSIGYASCHWCHVMEHEVFEHDDVAALMNANFVCIKVDREERPDLDSVYMDAVQAMTGRGGWPMSVFLTPDLKPFYGGTYYPHDAFLQLAGRINEVFREQRPLLERQSRQLVESLDRDLADGPDLELTPRLVAQIVDQGKSNVDRDWGGSRQSQKFPTPLRWRFLLHRYRETGDSELGDAIRLTLDRMADGGLRDQLGGGFHRYTVEPTWLVPHFEIMLYDNAQLAELYLAAEAAFPGRGYLEIGTGVLDFLIRDMTATGGGLCASFDADSGGEEGAYYVWTPDEIAEVVGPKDGPPLARLLGVTEAGNFEGASILTRRVAPVEAASEYGRADAEVAGLFDRHREALRRRRARRTPPARDAKVVTAWNGLAIGAFARGHALTGRDDYLAAARGIVDRLWAVHRDVEGRLHRASTDGLAVGEGILDDYAFLADGLIELYQAAGDPADFARAVELLDLAEARFADPRGGFFLTADDAEAPLGRRVEPFDSVEPSGASAMLRAMTRAAVLAGDVARHERAAAILERHAGLLRRAGLEMGWWAECAALHVGDPRAVVVAGDREDPAAVELVEAFWTRQLPDAVLATVPAAGADDATLDLLPALAGKTAVDGRATAYVCRFGACGRPAMSPAELLAQLDATK